MRAPHKNLIAILFWSASFYLGKILGSIFAFQNNVENFCVVANRSLRFTGGCGLGLHPLLFYGGIVMKKLKTWQKVLLIIFYPVGIVYFIVWLCKRNKGATPAPAPRSIIRDFNTKVVGVTFGNDDGTSRQEIIKACKPGDDIIFKPVPTEEYPDAIGVFNKRGQQLGHIGAELAVELKEKYANNPMSVTVNNITGGGDKNYGCNLHIVIYSL